MVCVGLFGKVQREFWSGSNGVVHTSCFAELKLMAAAFERAAQELKAAGAQGRVAVNDAQKLQLYALFKQATAGDCAAAVPSAFRVVERAKW